MRMLVNRTNYRGGAGDWRSAGQLRMMWVFIDSKRQKKRGQVDADEGTN